MLVPPAMAKVIGRTDTKKKGGALDRAPPLNLASTGPSSDNDQA